jgi:starch-binding outer membrane protein SusE/F
MKKYSLIYIVMAAILVLASCKKEEVGPVISDPTAPAISLPSAGTSLVLSQSHAKDTLTFEWSAATGYGFTAAVTYKVEMSLPGDDFAHPKVILTTTKLKGIITYGDFNNLLVAAEFTTGVSTDLKLRIAASVSDLVPAVYSTVLVLATTPYLVEVNYPKLSVPGSYQGWAPDKGPYIYSVPDNKKYEGYINFPDAGTQFKFTPQPNWDTDWGDDGADGTLDVKGANIVAADAGFYKINVNINDLTYTLVKTDWGVIGTATPGGWDSDQNMTFDPVKGKWSITVNLVAGEMKFRANDAWTINLGDNGGNLSLEYDGSNIVVAAEGNYTITLDLSKAIYTYVINKN